MASNYKRTRLWVDPAFQFRLLARMVCYFVLWAVAIVHINFIVEFVFVHMANSALHLSEPEAIGTLYVKFLRQLGPLLFTLLLTLPLLLRDLLKFSHRIAGPLYRCRRVMLDMAAGKAVAEFQPRKHDLMGELFQAFNLLIREWNVRVNGGVNGHAATRNATSNGEKPAPVPAEAAARPQ